MYRETSIRPSITREGKYREIYKNIMELNMERLVLDIGLDPNKVENIADLFCGEGLSTRAALSWFPSATITCVDYHLNDLMSPNIRKNPRVQAVSGYTVEYLLPYIKPSPDVTLMIHGENILQGVHDENLETFARFVGNGILSMSGDNGEIEFNHTFKRLFEKIHGNEELEGGCYLVKKDIKQHLNIPKQ